MPTPILPSQDEIDAHEIDHIPYRPWCRHCVEGFGREDHHSAHEEKRWLPVIAMDYLFVSKRGVFERTEYQPLEGEETLKVLVVRDSKSRSVFAVRHRLCFVVPIGGHQIEETK